jgi:hypothetical protein
MAVYKVPQDVEADDKLLGPFSFRQFIYLIIAVGSIALGWGLSRLFIPLAIIPLPVVLFFGVLALPLRKDQPMEIYMAAIVSFYLKPRKRLWKADGIQSLVEITAPKVIEIQRAKDISQTEAQQRLSYLADIVDTGGWAVRGVAQPEAPSALQNDVYFEARQTEDILDSNGGVARSFETMISQADAKRHQQVIERMHQPAPEPVAVAPAPPVVDPYATFTPAVLPQQNTFEQPVAPIEFNPYPSSMHQHVINPLGAGPAPQPVVVQPVAQPVAPVVAPQPIAPPPVAPAPAITTSEKTPSPDIINLANNADLSIETIAHEAKRIHEKQEDLNEEVVISFR